jgi:hypothetical protein
MNIYADDFYINAYEVKYNTIVNYYDAISRYPDVVNQWNHPWACGIRHLDSFSPYDPKLDDVMCLLEVNLRGPWREASDYLKPLTWLPCCAMRKQDNHKRIGGRKTT